MLLSLCLHSLVLLLLLKKTGLGKITQWYLINMQHWVHSQIEHFLKGGLLGTRMKRSEENIFDVTRKVDITDSGKWGPGAQCRGWGPTHQERCAEI